MIKNINLVKVFLMTKKLSFSVLWAGSGQRRIHSVLLLTHRKDGPTCFGGCERGGSGPTRTGIAMAPHRHEPPQRKNPAREYIGRLAALQRATPDLRADHPKPHLATEHRQDHPDEVEPLEARDPTFSKLRAAEFFFRAAEFFFRAAEFFFRAAENFLRAAEFGRTVFFLL